MKNPDIHEADFSLFPIFYALITTLPVTLFFFRQFFYQYHFPLLYLITALLILIIFYPVFRAFIRHNLYNFEDSESASSIIIVLTITVIGIAITQLVIKTEVLYTFLALPYILSLLFCYQLTVFDFVKNNSIRGIVKFMYFHLKKSASSVFIFSSVKIIFLIILLIKNINPYFPIIWIISFIFDFIIIVIIRNMY
ncbi:MAG: hypothetical protein PF518_17420, partial [Spirochaetaceae bacterium]|nr:hypothetical protein [Spirochaetaceae bacterium]